MEDSFTAKTKDKQAGYGKDRERIVFLPVLANKARPFDDISIYFTDKRAHYY